MKRNWLYFILAGSVLLRMGVAFALGDRIDALPAIYDQISYQSLAVNLVLGKGFQFDTAWYPFTPPATPTAHWSFLYPLYLAGIYALVGVHPIVARFVQALIGGLLLPGLLFLLTKRLAGQRVGILAAGWAAVYPFFIYFGAALMTETFHIAAVLAVLILSYKIVDQLTLAPCRWNGWLWLALGIALGIATLLRQATLLFIPFLWVALGWLLQKRLLKFFRGSVIALGILMACILPWTVRNYLVYGEFLLLNSNSGYALYWSNHPQNGDTFGREEVLNQPAPALPAKGLNEPQMDRLLTQYGIEFFCDDPGRILNLKINGMKTFFEFWPIASSGLLSNLGRVLSFGAALPFMLYGLKISLSDWRKYLLVYVFAVTWTAFHLVAWPGPRYRLPIDAVMLSCAALGLDQLLKRLGIQLDFLGIDYERQ